MTEQYEIVHYIENGKDIFDGWLKSLRDKTVRLAIQRSVGRVELGNFGKGHYCRDGVWEIVVNYGAGYRVYYSIVGNKVVLLLCGGSKRTQNRDIEMAVEYLKKYKEGMNDES